MTKQEQEIFKTGKSFEDQVYLCKEKYKSSVSDFITILETIGQSEGEFLEKYEYNLHDEYQEGLTKYRAIQEILKDTFENDREEISEFKDSFFNIMRNLYDLAW